MAKKKKQNPFGAKGWTPAQLGSLAGKTYVITGANTGAGYEATKVFLAKGARVVARQPEAGSYLLLAHLLEQAGRAMANLTFVEGTARSMGIDVEGVK